MRGLFRRLRQLAFIALAGVGISQPVNAQSLYACRNLDSARIPTIEGRQGVFYRIDPDMRMYNRFSDGIVHQISDLGRVLAEGGTRLVVVPMPTKAQAMPQYLGPDVSKFGYDEAMADAIYADTLARLQSAGVTRVDARSALYGVSQTQIPLFKTDNRLNNVGLLALAKAILRELGVTHAETVTEADGVTGLFSPERISLQARCLLQLPETTTENLRLVQSGTDTAPPDNPGQLAIVGTDLTGHSDLNFAYFMSGLSGHDVLHTSVAGDGIAAMTGFLTSDQFRQQRPDILVWELPVWINPGLYGDQPFREMQAAARNACSGTLDGTPTQDGQLRVVVPDMDQTRNHSLMLEYSATGQSRVDFHLFSPDKHTRSWSIIRKEGQPPTRRFYIPLTGYWPDQITQVDIEIGSDSSDLPTLSLCRG